VTIKFRRRSQRRRTFPVHDHIQYGLAVPRDGLYEEALAIRGWAVRKRICCRIRHDRAELEQRAAAIAETGPVPALLAAIKERQAHRDALVRNVAIAEIRQPRADRRTIGRHVRAKLRNWMDLLACRQIADGLSYCDRCLGGRCDLRRTAKLIDLKGRRRLAGCSSGLHPKWRP